MIVYLAYPIDLCSPLSEHHKVAADLSTILSKQAVVYEPGQAWSLTLEHASSLDLDRLSIINFAALDQADLLFALAPPKVPSVGVPIEVYHMLAVRDRKVALWFGVPDTIGIGAMWTHLISEFPDQVCVMPAVMSAADVTHTLNWAVQ